MKKEINSKLKKYLEEGIFPLYEKNNDGHSLEHIKYVISRSLKFAETVDDVDFDMVFTVAAYHDVGYHLDPKNHEKVSAKILREDGKLREFFTDEQIQIMSEAVADHRASSKHEPRSIYGKIVSSADRNTKLESPFRRTYSHRIMDNPSLTLDEIIEESRQHLLKKFGRDGYARDKIYFDDPEYREYLRDVTRLAENKDAFRKKYFEVNELENIDKNIAFLFGELKKHRPKLSLDQILYDVYVKLATDEPFDEMRGRMLELEGIREYGANVAEADKRLS